MMALLTVGFAVPALAQVDTADAKKKLLSKRAAEADAYRKLAESVNGLLITSETYVRDFVAESDIIQSAMDTFIRGIRLGPPKWFSDFSCEVPAEVTVAEVVRTIKEYHFKHYKGDQIKAKDIEQMEQRIDRKVIKVVGMGAPREDLPPGLPGGVADQLGGPPVPPDPPIPDLWKQVGPQGRMMALRAATLDAQRKLVERILGLRITSDTLVKDFVTESDQIQAVTRGTLVGFTETRRYFHHDEPIAEVTIEVPLKSVITTIKELHTRAIRGDMVKGKDIEEMTQQIKTQTFSATGMGIPPDQYLKRVEQALPAPLPDWAKMPIKMTGECPPPADKAGTAQGKLMAARCAELDAKRKLSEHINGLIITSQTSVKDFVTEHDEIRSYMEGVLVGASVDRTEYDGETAKVTVSIPGMQIWEIVAQRMRAR